MSKRGGDLVAVKLQSGPGVLLRVQHAAAPYNFPSVRARRALRLAFLWLPTAKHESFGHSCSTWGEMSPRWPSVLCACVCFSPHKRVLLLYKWPDSRPRGDAGKTSAGWRRHVGGTVTVFKWASESSWCAATVI